MQSSTNQGGTLTPLLTKEEVAGFLRVCERTVMRLVERGTFPVPVYVNKQPRWRSSDVEAWLAKGGS